MRTTSAEDAEPGDEAITRIAPITTTSLERRRRAAGRPPPVREAPSEAARLPLVLARGRRRPPRLDATIRPGGTRGADVLREAAAARPSLRRRCALSRNRETAPARRRRAVANAPSPICLRRHRSCVHARNRWTVAPSRRPRHAAILLRRYRPTHGTDGRVITTGTNSGPSPSTRTVAAETG